VSFHSESLPFFIIWPKASSRSEGGLREARQKWQKALLFLDGGASPTLPGRGLNVSDFSFNAQGMTLQKVRMGVVLWVHIFRIQVSCAELCNKEPSFFLCWPTRGSGSLTGCTWLLALPWSRVAGHPDGQPIRLPPTGCLAPSGRWTCSYPEPKKDTRQSKVQKLLQIQILQQKGAVVWSFAFSCLK
jgi:hypothetical protein